MNMTTPLPCPFCGEMPRASASQPPGTGEFVGVVICVGDCPAHPFVHSYRSEHHLDFNSAKEAAILRWNRRKEGK